MTTRESGVIAKLSHVSTSLTKNIGKKWAALRANSNFYRSRTMSGLKFLHLREQILHLISAKRHKKGASGKHTTTCHNHTTIVSYPHNTAMVLWASIMGENVQETNIPKWFFWKIQQRSHSATSAIHINQFIFWFHTHEQLWYGGWRIVAHGGSPAHKNYNHCSYITYYIEQIHTCKGT